MRGLKASFYISNCVFCVCIMSYVFLCVTPTAHYTMLGWPGRCVALGSPPVGPVASSCYSAVPDSAIIEAFMLKIWADRLACSCHLLHQQSFRYPWLWALIWAYGSYIISPDTSAPVGPVASLLQRAVPVCYHQGLHA